MLQLQLSAVQQASGVRVCSLAAYGEASRPTVGPSTSPGSNGSPSKQAAKENLVLPRGTLRTKLREEVHQSLGSSRSLT